MKTINGRPLHLWILDIGDMLSHGQHMCVIYLPNYPEVQRLVLKKQIWTIFIVSLERSR